jgi:hypothetical protein
MVTWVCSLCENSPGKFSVCTGCCSKNFRKPRGLEKLFIISRKLSNCKRSEKEVLWMDTFGHCQALKDQSKGVFVDAVGKSKASGLPCLQTTLRTFRLQKARRWGQSTGSCKSFESKPEGSKCVSRWPAKQ